ncbi:MAG: bifunctional DNA primase/polymerase, partial [Myxococcota bacterium]
MSNTTILDAALVWAEEGVPVFPVRGKRPTTRNGFHDAVTDADPIRAWLHGHSGLGIGAAMGKPCGYWVLDIDGPYGQHQLEQLVARFGALPETRRTKTRNGVHYWFLLPEGQNVGMGTQVFGAHPKIEALKHGAKEQMRGADKATRKRRRVELEASIAQLEHDEPDVVGGIDLRGTGSYVVLPPSPHPDGGTYQLVDDTHPAAAPTWLVELVAGDSKTRRALFLTPKVSSPPANSRPRSVLDRMYNSGGSSSEGDRKRARFDGMLRHVLTLIETAVKGERNTVVNEKCYELGGFVDDAGVDPEAILPALEAASVAAEQPRDLPRRALEAGRAKPRKLSELPDERPQSGPQVSTPNPTAEPPDDGHLVREALEGALDLEDREERKAAVLALHRSPHLPRFHAQEDLLGAITPLALGDRLRSASKAAAKELEREAQLALARQNALAEDIGGAKDWIHLGPFVSETEAASIE